MWQRETFKKIKQVPGEEHVLPGSALCAGCGGLESLRLAAKVLGDEVVYVNAAGCFTMLAAYPYTSFKGSWLYTTMGSAPAGAQGVRDALDVLIAKGRLPKRENLKVVVLGGDGSTYDMALSSTSGAMNRGLDFYYICYDNEAYGNTGMQLSPATPYGARTATSQRESSNKNLQQHFYRLRFRQSETKPSINIPLLLGSPFRIVEHST